MEKKEVTYHVSLSYSDESESWIDMTAECLADVMMAARGWLMASLADKVIIYDEDGFAVESYVKR